MEVESFLLVPNVSPLIQVAFSVRLKKEVQLPDVKENHQTGGQRGKENDHMTKAP